MVEDSVDDTFFVVRELQRGGYQVDFERVETAAGMKEALQRGNWDLVVSDYQMPQFDGAAALALHAENGADAPFIMVSGAIGEESAVEMVKRGANDYVMKDNLARLVPAVQRELRYAQERRIHKQAEAAVAYLAAIVQSSDDAIVGKNLEGTILSWNRGAEKLYGYSAIEMIGRSVSVLFPPELRKESSHILKQIRNGEHLEGLETVRLRKNGTPVEVSLTISPVRDSSGRIIGASTFARERTPARRSRAAGTHAPGVRSGPKR